MSRWTLRDQAVRDGHLFRVGRRMLAAVLVARKPVGVDRQGDVGGIGQEPLHDVGGEQRVGVGADERLVHQVFGVHQRDQDVVVLPVGVVAEGKLRVSGAHRLDPVAADEADVVDVGPRHRLQRPVEQAPAAHLGKAFRRVRRGRHEAPAASGADDDSPHGGLRLIGEPRRDAIALPQAAQDRLYDSSGGPCLEPPWHGRRCPSE